MVNMVLCNRWTRRLLHVGTEHQSGVSLMESIVWRYFSVWKTRPSSLTWNSFNTTFLAKISHHLLAHLGMHTFSKKVTQQPVFTCSRSCCVGLAQRMGERGRAVCIKSFQTLQYIRHEKMLGVFTLEVKSDRRLAISQISCTWLLARRLQMVIWLKTRFPVWLDCSIFHTPWWHHTTLMERCIFFSLLYAATIWNFFHLWNSRTVAWIIKRIVRQFITDHWRHFLESAMFPSLFGSVHLSLSKFAPVFNVAIYYWCYGVRLGNGPYTSGVLVDTTPRRMKI